MHILTGLRHPDAPRERSILTRFWSNFKRAYPQHQVFQRLEPSALERAVPLLVHGDEGRGRRHGAHFVLSFHSWMGLGFSKSKSAVSDSMACNFAGHTFTNRFLIASLRKQDYSDDARENWNLLMETIAKETGYMWQTGVYYKGFTYYGIVLSIIGDWPFLHNSAGFSRSFNNVMKKLNTTQNKGICHLCKAGQDQFDFEQLGTRRPTWMSSMFTDSPFISTSPFETYVLHIPGQLEAVWSFDWFHTMHLGVIRNFLGSTLGLLSEEETDGNIDGRFASLSQKYRAWCQQHSRPCFLKKLTKEAIGWESSVSSTYPSGTWHKGSLSTTLMEYVEYRLSHESFPHQPLLGLAAEACEAVQSLSRTLFRSGVWLTPEDCKRCAELGFRFLRRYNSMVELSHSTNRCLFVLQPKMHVLHHFMVDMWSCHLQNIPGVNPLARSCQPSEDFIGRPSRLSRRVTSQRPVLHRIMDRYLQSAYGHFVKAKYLIRPSG